VNKLAAGLAKPLTSEEQVVYVLSLVRKLLEYDKLERKAYYHASLTFYCNWALHTRIERSSGGQLLRHLDSEIPTLLAGKPIRKPATSPDNYVHGSAEPKIIHILPLASFQLQLGVLLSHYNIKQHDSWWEDIFKYYLDVVANCPVSYNRATIRLKYIDSLVITKSLEPLTYTWELSKGGTIIYSWKITDSSASTLFSPQPAPPQP
jgi:hypothetical protein